jgi:hypothetical protein
MLGDDNLGVVFVVCLGRVVEFVCSQLDFVMIETKVASLILDPCHYSTRAS